MTANSNDVRIVVSPPSFSDWTGLLAMLRSAYESNESRIDPPSSLLRMDIEQLEQKAREEVLILALEAQRVVGCAFACLREDCVYVGKLAVDAAVRGRGVARRIMQVVETLAHANARPFVELETRVELIENHETFAALGFSKVAESAHPGFDRVTSITMRKPVRTESLPADASELANVEFGSSGSPRQAHRMRSRGQPHLLQWGLTFEAVGWQSVTRLGGRPVRLDD